MTNNNPNDPLLSMVGREIQAEWFRGLVAQQMWCAKCDHSLDCRSAVKVDVNADGNWVYQKIFCADCYEGGLAEDIELRTMHHRVAKAMGKAYWAGPPEDCDTLPLFESIDPTEQPDGSVHIYVELTDGRTFTDLYRR
jgi:hypothetical protein